MTYRNFKFSVCILLVFSMGPFSTLNSQARATPQKTCHSFFKNDSSGRTFSNLESSFERLQSVELENPLTEGAKKVVPIPLAIQNTLKKNPLLKNVRGYSIILSIMLFSATTSSYISSRVASDYPFMIHFISQISVLGIVVIGAPIWEPMSSYFRNLAFRLNKENESFENTVPSDYLETLWHSTQKKFSINSQMSRNVLASAINNIQINLFQSHRAFQKGDYSYAVLQIAAMAVRLRTLYSEIPPDDMQVALAFHSILKYEMQKHPQILKDTWTEIQNLDPQAFEYSEYYHQVLRAWLQN